MHMLPKPRNVGDCVPQLGQILLKSYFLIFFSNASGSDMLKGGNNSNYPTTVNPIHRKRFTEIRNTRIRLVNNVTSGTICFCSISTNLPSRNTSTVPDILHSSCNRRSFWYCTSDTTSPPSVYTRVFTMPMCQ